MSSGEIVTLVMSLITLGTAIIATLVRMIFVGIRSRIDSLERKVDRCMEEIIRAAKR